MKNLNLPTQPSYASRRSPVLAQNIVSTSHPLASQAGLNMIAQGGNAIDAAIASAITLTVVEPTGCGLGSDAFAIIWDGKSLHGLNASGRSPADWHYERFANFKTMPFRGWESVTVPGAVSSWLTLSKDLVIFRLKPYLDLQLNTQTTDLQSRLSFQNYGKLVLKS